MGKKILIVDDEASILFAMSDYFTRRGYEVECARELEEAEACLGRTRYAGVIVDLRLSGSHGAEGLDIVRLVRERYRSTRTIMLTAYGSPQIELEARRRGVDVFLHKPKPLPELARAVEELLTTGGG